MTMQKHVLEYQGEVKMPIVDTRSDRYEAGSISKSRISSIDLLRGLIMIIMALDHVRYYFHYDAFHYDPADLSQTSVALFFTRWITHFCAPVFVFLAGTSAFLSGQKVKSRKALSIWLIKRGLWLIVLEFTLVKLAWMFKLDYEITLLLVIWILGISMIALAAFIHLPKYLMLISGLVIVCGHNLLDGVIPPFLPEPLWKIMHISFSSIVIGDTTVIVGYPVLPWIGLMVLGYYFGMLYKQDFGDDVRRNIIMKLGITITIFFVLLRLTNTYGEPVPWSEQESTWFTILSFLNTTKYPPSLLYLCMTIGPSLILLTLFEKADGWWAKKLVVVGRVPLFYYLLHLYLIHFLAVIAAVVMGYTWSDMVVDTMWINTEPQLHDYGFSLPFVYFVWVMVVIMLYPLCRWYHDYKNQNRDKWWLSYL
ncbi:membrane protein, putative [Fulvivirga imtechensis AK7]|uniref:Membrane protein, putative n=2 Tax=Fulvivirga TaxID=396811 RepID=L8JZ57_9BACT|nr:membrane protein, putative [Fulvivirga imtechensis AK7]